MQTKRQVKLEYAKFNGEIHHVDDFQGYQKPYPFMVCPGCTAPVTPVLGDERARHARHTVSADCYGESAEHLNAKYRLIIQLSRAGRLVTQRRCDLCNKLEAETFAEDWEYVTDEHKVGNYIVDVALVSNNTYPVVIEVYFTHAVPNEKIVWFNMNGIKWLEVKADAVLRWDAQTPLPYLRRSDHYWHCAGCVEMSERQEKQTRANVKNENETPQTFISYTPTFGKIDPDNAIQWSRKYSLWHCIHCRAVSKNKDYDSIIHDIKTVDGLGNLLQHSQQCKYWAYLEAQGIKETQL